MNNKINIKLVYAIVLVVALSSPAIAGTNLTISLDATGSATFTGHGTDLSESLPAGVSFNNGTISGSTMSLTRKTGSEWSLSFSFPDSDITVVLPKQAIVKTVVGELVTSNNQLIAHGNNSVYVSYTLNDAAIARNAAAVDMVSLQNKLIIAVVLVILVGLAVRLNYVQRRASPKNAKISRKRNDAKKIALLQQLLNEKENIILTIVREKGAMKSSYLQREAGIPKSSFFRNLQELEKKKLIRRTGLGRNKFVELVGK